MEIEKLIEALGDLEMCAFGYHINGEVLGKDCTDFECLMADAAEEISKIPALQAENERLRRERDAAVIDMTALAAGHCCDLCAVEYCIVRGNTEMCTAFKWRGPKEEKKDD